MRSALDEGAGEVQRIITISLGILFIIAVVTIDAAITARSILYSYRAEIAYLKQQQEANAATINYLVDQTFYLMEVQRASKNQSPR